MRLSGSGAADVSPELIRARARRLRRPRLPLLRHDRVPDGHLGPARRSRGQAATAPTAGRCRAPSRAWSTNAGRPVDRGRRGRDRGLRSAALRRLPRRRAQRRAFTADGFFRTGDLGVHGRRRLRPHHRAPQGHHHPQGREPLRQGHRGRAGRPSRGRRRRGRRRARPATAASACARASCCDPATRRPDARRAARVHASGAA